MKSKLLLPILICVCLIMGAIFPASAQISTANRIFNDIINYNLDRANAVDIQDWIDTSLSQDPAGSEWYIIALSQSGNYDYSLYRTALEKYLSENKVTAVSSRQKYALTLIATGSKNDYILSVMEDSIGKQGVMSWIYGLHLLNNGYQSSQYTLSYALQKLLSLQLDDGGWAVMGNVGDNDVTAMAVQSLAPHYTDPAVHSAVDRALCLLSSRQNEDGDFYGYGIPNCESTAQVMIAISSLGIDALTDSRFIKNGHTLLDGLQKYRLANGSFSHQADAAFNETATVQALCSFVAYNRMSQGKDGLYILDKRNPDIFTAPSSAPTTSEDHTSAADSAVDNVVEPPQSISDGSSVIEQAAKNNISQEISAPSDVTDTLTSSKIDESKPNIQYIKNSEQIRISYKAWAILAVILVSSIVCLILFVLKKRSPKNFIAILAVSALMICFVLLTDFRSADDYYGGEAAVKENAVGSVTLSIRCDSLVGRSDSQYIPADGIILEESEFTIDTDDTVYDILTDAARQYKLRIESSGGEGLVYVTGINYLYEFDFGDLSGWMYYVNGENQPVGCDEYILSDGDNVEWLYTCNLGKDLKR